METTEQQDRDYWTNLIVVVLPLCSQKKTTNSNLRVCLQSGWFMSLPLWALSRQEIPPEFDSDVRKAKGRQMSPSFQASDPNRPDFCFQVISSNVLPTEAGSTRSVYNNESSTLSVPLQRIPDPRYWLWFNLMQTEVGCRLQPVTLWRLQAAKKLAALLNPNLCCYIEILF